MQSISLMSLPEASADTAAEVAFFDPPMCCPTGLCGPALDQTLLDVNEMILALQALGIRVARYQMTSHPQQFINNGEVMRLVREQQMAAVWGATAALALVSLLARPHGRARPIPQLEAE